MLGLVISLLCGILIGVACTRIIYNIRNLGTICVDDSDPDDDPYLFLELHSNVSDVVKRKHITLKVDVKNYLSQK